MPKRYRINLLDHDERKRKSKYEPTLRLSLNYRTGKPLRLEKAPREIRDQIYCYVFAKEPVIQPPQSALMTKLRKLLRRRW
jgi:hypothetical protein